MGTLLISHLELCSFHARMIGSYAHLFCINNSAVNYFYM